MLSSSIARKQLDHLGDWPKALFATIDQISDIFDGLVAVRETVNPSETEEARAVKYRDAHQRATARVDQLLQDAVGRLVDRERKLQADALARAELNRASPLAAEIRATLRGMSQADRDRAVTDAVASGNADVILAIQSIPEMLRGPLSVPVETTTRLFLEQTSPTLTADLADVSAALETLNLAAGAWRRAAEEMRDLPAERRADEGAEAQKMASWKLGVALQAQLPE
jgi:hypothetical protein